MQNSNRVEEIHWPEVFEPLDINGIGSRENSDDIKRINTALNECKRAIQDNQINPQILHNLIEACETYITQIPKERRRRSNETMPWVKVLPEWPIAEKVLQIQKKAVSLFYLPENPNLAKARWKMIRTVFDIPEKGKTLASDYLIEARFHGEMAIANWIMSSDYLALHDLKSFHETTKDDANRIGIDKRQVIYLKDPSSYQLTLDDTGKIRFRGILYDTNASTGANIKSGECMFAASVDGAIYSSDPAERVPSQMHHSSFLQGKRVLCAGAIKANQGEITQITVLSGHYKPGRKELLNFLSLLKNKYKVNLKNITVIDQPGGLPKNALRYLQNKGITFPDDKNAMLLKLAVDAFENKNWERAQDFLEQAVARGHEEALLNKAIVLVENPNMYPNISQKDKRNELAQAILAKLAKNADETGRNARIYLRNFNQYSQPEIKSKETILTIEDQIDSLRTEVFKLERDRTPQEQIKEKILHEMKIIIESVQTIPQLYAFYEQLSGIQGGFLREEKGIHAFFQAEGLTKRWGSVVLMLQEHAFNLAAADKTGISKGEKKQLYEIWQAPVERIDLSIFKKKSFKKEFEELVAQKKISLLETQLPLTMKKEKKK